MAEEGTNEARAWPYVHGELEEQERLDMEAALEADRDLAEEVADSRRGHDNFAALFPQLRRSKEELAEELEAWVLQEWKSEQHAGGEMPGSEPGGETLDAPGGKAFRMPRYVRIALAVAACLMVALGMHITTASRLHWDDPLILPFETRGSDAGGVVAVYGQHELQQVTHLMRSAIDGRYRALTDDRRGERGPWWRNPWRLQISVLEQARGQIKVVAEAYLMKGAAPLERWEQQFISPEDVESRASAWSEEIALYLAEHEIALNP